MKKITLIIILIFMVYIVSFVKIEAAYNYSPLGDVIASAEALISKKVVDSSNLVDINNTPVDVSFGELADVFTHNDKIYIVDKSNSCVIVLNDKYQFITKFGDSEEVKFTNPSGIFVTDDFIYVADTNGKRVAVLTHDYVIEKEIKNPNDPTFKQSDTDPNGYDFKPLKVAVDRTGRIYVIADQIFEGVIDFNSDGTFSRYVGANSVTVSAWDAFWLLFTSKEQRKNQGVRLTTTFNNLNIDKKGFIYTVSNSTEASKVIKKLNREGVDILTRNGYFAPVGDVWTINGRVNVPKGSSELIDIDVNEYGNYSVLDRVRGRIFTYDFEGNLLYIGGRIGNVGGTTNNQSSLFLKPEALCYYGNNILVVDSMNKNLVVLEFTEFANLVNKATELYFDGDYQGAGKVWEEVLVLNTNYYLAYAGIGKAQLYEGNYEDALENLKLGYDDYNYSKAYKQYRYDQLTNIFPYILGVVITGIVSLFILSIKKSVDNEREDEKNE